MGQESPIITEGYTFDDLLLEPQYSEVLPADVDVQTTLSRRIRLKVPMVSAAMDTVTESRMAIAMAQAGGLGVVHRNMSAAEQAQQIVRVKKSESGMITEPVTVSPHATVDEVLGLMKNHNISGLPIVENGTLVGIVTNRDIRFETNREMPVSRVMTSDVVTAREGTTPQEAVATLQKHRIEKLPVLADDGRSLVGLYTIKDIEKAKTYPHASKDSRGRLMVGAAIGAGAGAVDRCRALLEAEADVIVIDTAHAHSKGVLETVKRIRSEFQSYEFDLIVGNIATAEGAESLVEAGADAIKVGVGPGSICTTRMIAGIGVPQLTAIWNCARVGEKHGVPVIADGGIKYSGDIVKALAAGARSVMVGSLLAGTDEAPGDLFIYQGKSYKTYRGMGSLGAMAKGSKDRYFQSHVTESSDLVPEGIEGRVPYKGTFSKTLHQLVGGVKSGMGYVGAPRLEVLRDNPRFVHISSSGLRESHAHDVFITRESPNYQR